MFPLPETPLETESKYSVLVVPWAEPSRKAADTEFGKLILKGLASSLEQGKGR